MLEMKDILFSFFSKLRAGIIAEQQAQGRYASGKTSRELDIETDDRQGILFGPISALSLETGRKPGAGPKGFTDIILDWMASKSLFQAENKSKQKSIAFLIARKIRESGTKLYRDGGKSGVLSGVITEEKIKEFESMILERFGREVQEEVLIGFGK